MPAGAHYYAGKGPDGRAENIGVPGNFHFQTKFGTTFIDTNQGEIILDYRGYDPVPSGRALTVFGLLGQVAEGLVVDRIGIRVLRDPYSAKPYVLFYTTKRVGGGVQNFEAIKLMKFAVS